MSFQFSSAQLLSHVWLFATRWTTAHQASLSITNSQSLPKLMSAESEMPTNHLILCRALLLLPSNFPSIRDFSSESAVLIRWPKYWRYTENIMRNARLDKLQAGIKTAMRNINNLRYADDTILMAESKEGLKSLLMQVKAKKLAYNSTLKKLISWHLVPSFHGK